jgi:hypothetical protein
VTPIQILVKNFLFRLFENNIFTALNFQIFKILKILNLQIFKNFNAHQVSIFKTVLSLKLVLTSQVQIKEELSWFNF